MPEEPKEPIRFGAEFGPYRSSRSSGVSLSTFKTLVWTSNVGGLILMVIGLELLIVTHAYTCDDLFHRRCRNRTLPFELEIVGMEPEESQSESDSE